MDRIALEDFHYAADGRNAVRFERGQSVPVREEHVAGLVEQGKIAADRPAVPVPQPMRRRRKR